MPAEGHHLSLMTHSRVCKQEPLHMCIPNQSNLFFGWVCTRDDGMTSVLTPQHFFWTREGWIVDLLARGELVHCSFSANAPGAVELVILLKLSGARKLCPIFQFNMHSIGLMQAVGALHCAVEWVWGEFNHSLKLSSHIFKLNQAIAIKH